MLRVASQNLYYVNSVVWGIPGWRAPDPQAGERSLRAVGNGCTSGLVWPVMELVRETQSPRRRSAWRTKVVLAVAIGSGLGVAAGLGAFDVIAPCVPEVRQPVIEDLRVFQFQVSGLCGDDAAVVAPPAIRDGEPAPKGMVFAPAPLADARPWPAGMVIAPACPLRVAEARNLPAALIELLASFRG
ncbi:MAG: hypothetical protein JWO36_1940 [Myxococcales bacterium]|nr:hypothetical protein [Myxococcales bacterium]